MRPAVCVLLSLGLLAGCGGGAKKARGGDEGSARAAVARLPAADRVAFYQLATIDGVVRAALTGGQGLPALADGRARLAGLAPRDSTLRQVRAQLSSALSAAVSRARRRALAATDAAYRGLLRYERAHPAVGALVPD